MTMSAPKELLIRINPFGTGSAGRPRASNEYAAPRQRARGAKEKEDADRAAAGWGRGDAHSARPAEIKERNLAAGNFREDSCNKKKLWCPER